MAEEWVEPSDEWKSEHTAGDLEQAKQNYRMRQAQASGSQSAVAEVENETANGYIGRGNYISPGAADVGGYRGGFRDMQADGLANMGWNDAQQASNSAAMGRSLQNMQTDRGQQVAQNPFQNMRVDRSRNQQLDAMSQLRNAATGGAPSAAEFQTRQGMNDLMGQAAGTQGTARGLSALNGAQSLAGTAGAQAAGGIMGSGAAGRAAEISDAMGMYGSNAGSFRGQDLDRLASSDQNSMFNSKLNNDWKLGNANLAAQQGQLGNAMGQMDQNWYQAAQDPTYRQLSYDQQMNAIANGASADSAAAAFERNKESNASARQMAAGGVQAGLTAVGSLAGPVGTVAGATAGGMAGSAIQKYGR